MSAAAVLHSWAPELPEVLDRLGPDWTRIDRVPFGATVDIEHVLLSPFGLAVVTTLDSVPEAVHPVTEARWRARKITALLGRAPGQPARAIPAAPATAEPGTGPRAGCPSPQAGARACGP